jgi:hypothetical protein
LVFVRGDPLYGVLAVAAGVVAVAGVANLSGVRGRKRRVLSDRRSLALVTLVGGPTITAVIGAALAVMGVSEGLFAVLCAVGIAASAYSSARGAVGPEVWAWGLGTFAISLFAGGLAGYGIDALLH